MTLEINLPKNVEKILVNLAKEHKITTEELSKRAILEYLQDLEDYKDALKARKSRKNGSSGIEAKEFFERMGI